MYNKIFTKILDSSVWLEPTPTRIVWITMIAAMDENGFCQFAAIGNVAGRARVTEDEARKAIHALESPDPESSDDSNEGRRIERVPGGWMVLNAPKYRAIVTRVNAQERTKERVRRFREKKHSVTSSNAPVTPSNKVKRERNADVTPSEAETEANTEKPSRKRAGKETKTALAKSRHDEFKAIIKEYWDSKNKDVQMPWDGREGKHLEMLLRAIPNMTAEQFRGFLRNRYKSEVNHSERASQWIDWVTSYAAGPIDRFGKTIHNGNGLPNPGAQPEAYTDEQAHQMWLGMSDEFKRTNPWTGR
jgi:hypothetical protein